MDREQLREQVIQTGRSAITMLSRMTGRIMDTTVDTATTVGSRISDTLPDAVSNRLDQIPDQVRDSRLMNNPLMDTLRGIATSSVARLGVDNTETTTTTGSTARSPARATTPPRTHRTS